MKQQVSALSVLLALFAVSSSVALAQFVSPEITVASNTLTMVAGPAGMHNAPVWVKNTAYAQGAVVKSQGTGPTYFALVAGTSTNVTGAGPVGNGNVTDGTVTWRMAPSKAREIFSVQDVGTNSACRTYVFVKHGQGNNLASVVTLFGAGGSYLCDAGDVPQSAVYVISTMDTKVTVNE